MDDRRLVIRTEADVAQIRRMAREVALTIRLGPADTEAVALAVSELATNLARYAPGGMISLSAIEEGGRTGLQLESRDAGPGIADLGKAMQDGFSTGGGMGSGLPAARRLMDEFAIATGAGGTTIVARKWRPKR